MDNIVRELKNSYIPETKRHLFLIKVHSVQYQRINISILKIRALTVVYRMRGITKAGSTGKFTTRICM